MNDLFLELGEFGYSARYRQLFGEMTVPATVTSIETEGIIVSDDLYGFQFLVESTEIVSPDPKLGDRMDCVVLVEAVADLPGIASERRACRVGVNVESRSARIVNLDTEQVALDIEGETQTLKLSANHPAMLVGQQIRIERHVSGAIWIA
jgi:hypothetical protein